MTEYVCGIEDNYEGVPWGSDDYSGTCERREEIVRCSDYAHSSSACLEEDPEALHCIVMDGIMSPNGFCSFGERSDGDGS